MKQLIVLTVSTFDGSSKTEVLMQGKSGRDLQVCDNSSAVQEQFSKVSGLCSPAVLSMTSFLSARAKWKMIMPTRVKFNVSMSARPNFKKTTIDRS